MPAVLLPKTCSDQLRGLGTFLVNPNQQSTLRAAVLKTPAMDPTTKMRSLLKQAEHFARRELRNYATWSPRANCICREASAWIRCSQACLRTRPVASAPWFRLPVPHRKEQRSAELEWLPGVRPPIGQRS